MGRRQFGAIRRLPSGKWQARFPAPGGQLVPAPERFSTKAEAGRYLAEVEVRMARGDWTHPAASRVRLDDYASAWLAGRRVRGRPLAPRTVAATATASATGSCRRWGS